MPDDQFPIEVVEGVSVVVTPPEVDITNGEALRSALLKAATNGYRTLVVDMTTTQFCDSHPGFMPWPPRTGEPKPTAERCYWSFPALPSSGSSRSPAWTS